MIEPAAGMMAKARESPTLVLDVLPVVEADPASAAGAVGTLMLAACSTWLTRDDGPKPYGLSAAWATRAWLFWLLLAVREKLNCPLLVAPVLPLLFQAGVAEEEKFNGGALEKLSPVLPLLLAAVLNVLLKELEGPNVRLLVDSAAGLLAELVANEKLLGVVEGAVALGPKENAPPPPLLAG